LKRTGNIDTARQVCVQLAIANNVTLGQLCGIELLLSTGQYNKALASVKPIIKLTQPLNNEIYSWALSIAAESALASGKLKESSHYYDMLNKNGVSNITSITHYADVLIKLNQYKHALSILPKGNHSIPFILRAAIVKTQGSLENDADVVSEIKNRLFSLTVGENELLPEKVMYYLWVDEKPQQAFKLAKKHWQKQRAWEDTELLLSSAKALGSEVEAQTKEEIEKWRLQWLH